MTKKWFFYASTIALSVCIAFYACNKDEDDPDPIEPDLDDPSLIAEDNLIAYFPFEGDGKCAISGITPSNATSPVTFPEGRRGKAFQGTAAANSGLLYALPTGHKLRDLNAFTFAVWVKTAPNTVATGEAPEQMVFQLDGRDGDIWGNFAFLQKRNLPEQTNPDFRDFGQMQTFFFKEDAADWHGQFVGDWWLDVTSTQWRHIICAYDNVTSKFSAYVNGVHVTRHDGTPYAAADRTQGEDGPPFGALKFKGAANFAIGAWAEKLMGKALLEDDWAASYRGQMDELRIYDKALTAAEAKELYDKEVLKIN